MPELTDSQKRILEKNASFGLTRFPLGFWTYTNLTRHGVHMDEAEIDRWADCGFTLTMTPFFDPDNPEEVEHTRRILDWAGERDMKLIVSDPRVHGPFARGGGADPNVPRVLADYEEKAKAAAELLGDHPAVWGFHQGDEPEEVDNERFFAGHRILKKVAPHLHPFMNLFPMFVNCHKTVGYPTWPEYLDAVVEQAQPEFLCYDCYAQMKGQESHYFDNLRLYREAAQRAGIPFWTTLLSVGHFRYRCPSLDDIRWQFNTAIASGVSGLLWFFYYMREPHGNYRLPPIDELWEPTQTYYDLRRVQTAFNRRYGDLFLHLASTRVSFWPEANGRREGLHPGRRGGVHRLRLAGATASAGAVCRQRRQTVRHARE